MKILFLIAFILPLTSFSESCKYLADKDDVKLSWVAFKTPLKVGVGGRFEELGIKTDLSGDSLASFLQGIEFKINSASTKTGNSSRDSKIVKYFFKKMVNGLDISGKTYKYSKKVLFVDLRMNNVSNNIELKVTQDENQIIAQGVIDVYDFSLHDSLKGINMACKELHQGKTWNDVEVKLVIPFTKKCS